MKVPCIVETSGKKVVITVPFCDEDCRKSYIQTEGYPFVISELRDMDTRRFPCVFNCEFCGKKLEGGSHDIL